ncbi:hypothetical protein L7F22_038859 [Adiantum nelumboides]|nr:hypothetical protein [Adiantum nelumboides]
MNTIVYGASCLPTLTSVNSLRCIYSVNDVKFRSLIIPSKPQQQQLQPNDNNTANNAPVPPFQSEQSTQGKEGSDSVDMLQMQDSISSNSSTSEKTLSKDMTKSKRLLRKEKASRKAVRRLRLLQAKAAESNNERVKEKALISASRILEKVLALNEPTKSLSSTNKISYSNQPSPDDKDEWRRAMLRLFSFIRKDYKNDPSLDYRASDTKERFKFNNTELRDERKSEVLPAATQINDDTSSNYNPSEPSSRKRSTRALINAHAVEQARQSQPDMTPVDKVTVGSNIAPVSGVGANAQSLLFDKTSMHYPPADRYPPPIPLVRELDLDLAAAAFGINRACDVHWVQGKGNDHSDGIEAGGAWRKIMHGPEHFVKSMDSDRMDTGQGLEYIGDSVLHLVSKSCIMAKFPRRTMMLYNFAANWLVSNDVFGHMFIDSGLNEERKYVADILLNQSKQRELEQMRVILTDEQFQLRKNAPLPAQQLPVVQHLRQADLFEGYVGAIYLTFGFHKASEWSSALFEPWIDRLARTENFLTPASLTQAGEVRIQIEKQIREEVRREYEQSQQTKPNGLLASAGNWLRSTFKRKSI